MRYIEINPVGAGMVALPKDYVWSSYRGNALGEKAPNTDRLTFHEEYLRLGSNAVERQEAYQQLFDNAIPGIELAEIRECARIRGGRSVANGSRNRSRPSGRGAQVLKAWVDRGTHETVSDPIISDHN